MPRKSSTSHNRRYENFRNPEGQPWNLQTGGGLYGWRPEDVARFWAKVSSNTSPPCWLWMGGLVNGYGQFVYQQSDGVQGHQTAHRVAYTLAHHQPIPAGQCVLHRCGVPICVRPDHLYLGTMTDAVRHAAGRRRRQRETVQ